MFESELAESLQTWTKSLQATVSVYAIARLEWKLSANAFESYLKYSQNCCLWPWKFDAS